MVKSIWRTNDSSLKVKLFCQDVFSFSENSNYFTLKKLTAQKVRHSWNPNQKSNHFYRFVTIRIRAVVKRNDNGYYLQIYKYLSIVHIVRKETINDLLWGKTLQHDVLLQPYRSRSLTSEIFQAERDKNFTSNRYKCVIVSIVPMWSAFHQVSIFTWKRHMIPLSKININL